MGCEYQSIPSTPAAEQGSVRIDPTTGIPSFSLVNSPPSYVFSITTAMVALIFSLMRVSAIFIGFAVFKIIAAI